MYYVKHGFLCSILKAVERKKPTDRPEYEAQLKTRTMTLLIPRMQTARLLGSGLELSEGEGAALHGLLRNLKAIDPDGLVTLC